MIGVARGVQVFAYAQACDMRKSFDTLAALVTEELKRDLLSGDLYLFVGRDRRRAKVLYFDGTGLCVYAKRLEKGRFAAPWKRARSNRIEMTLSELALFVEGSEEVLRRKLSPPLMREVDLRSKFPEATP
jgi:transposase